MTIEKRKNGSSLVPQIDKWTERLRPIWYATRRVWTIFEMFEWFSDNAINTNVVSVLTKNI